MKRNKPLLGWATLALLSALGPALITCRAQLVADGATAFINGTSTNLTGDLTVGTNGAFTTLVITNAGAVTNTGVGYIGYNFSAVSNRVIVTGANSTWGMGGNLNLGYTGSGSLLIVTNGGRVQDNYGIISASANSSGDAVIVTGANSVWTNQNNLNIGQSGPSNSLTVTNGGTAACADALLLGNQAGSNQVTVTAGGRIWSGDTILAFTANSSRNVALITGAGSEWHMSGAFSVGFSGPLNQLWLTKGAKMWSQQAGIGINTLGGGGGSSNLVTIADPGSSWTNMSTIGVGTGSSSYNGLVITNGGVVQCLGGDSSVTLGVGYGSSNNWMAVAGNGSLFSNEGGGNPTITVGSAGSFNQLSVSNGGVVRGESGFIGYNTASSNNVALVAGTNAQWINASQLWLGYLGSYNSLMISDGGTVITPQFIVSFDATASNNAVTLAGGNLIATNGGSGVTEVRSGALTMYTGLLQTDRLLLTNGQRSQFTLSGGTLQTGSTIVTNGGTFIVGNGNFNLPPATFQLVGNGSHSFEQGIYVMNSSTLSGNGTINGMLTVGGGGTLAPGSGGSAPAFGKITFAKSPLFQGVISMRLSKTGAVLTNDQIQVNAPLFYGDWLVVSNIGPGALTLGDRFKLFSSSSTMSGYFNAIYLPPLAAGLNWTNKLTLDGSIEVVPWSGPKLSTDLSASPSLYLDVTDGFPGGSYDVLTATNITSTNWTVIASGTFDWNGVTSAYVGSTEATPASFFRLQIHWP